MKHVIEDLYGIPVTDDLSGISHEEHAVRRALLALGFELEEEKYFFQDKYSKRIIYFESRFVHVFSDVYALMSAIRKQPELPDAAVALCDVIQTKTEALAMVWERARIKSWLRTASMDLSWLAK